MFVAMGKDQVHKIIKGRDRYLRVCALMPFAALLWVWLVFGAFSLIDLVVLHQDIGFTFTHNPHALLPNGYTLGSVGRGIGYISAPGVRIDERTNLDALPRDWCAVADVAEVQLVGPYILGKHLVRSRSAFAENSADYFLLDTRSRAVSFFASRAEFEKAAAASGLKPSLEYLWAAYWRYRTRWTDWLLPVVQILGVLAMVGTLWSWGERLRVSVND